MNCDQVKTMLESNILQGLRSRKYPALHRHVLSCKNCLKLWERWQCFDEKLSSLLNIVQAPEGLRDKVMAELKEIKIAKAHKDYGFDIFLEGSPEAITGLELHSPPGAHEGGPNVILSGISGALAARARTQIAEYFRGERAIFRLPVDLSRCNPFERRVLETANEIPYGEVRSYKWIAEHMGRPGAWRAVGRALHNNPAPVIVPCHRVIRSDGSAGGYAFGEEWKACLLSLEEDAAPFIGCSSTRIVCYRGCRRERRIREGGRIHYAQMMDAMESAYRPCKICNPG